MVNLLVVCENIGKSASGIVIESFLKYFDQNCDINLTVICNKNYSKHQFSSLIELSFKPYKINLFYKLSLILFKNEPNSNKWVNNALNEINNRKIDAVLAISGAYCFRPFHFANVFGKMKNIPYLLHALDPIPSTKGWGENSLLRYGIMNTIKPYFEMANGISASNSRMVDYQCNILGLRSPNKFFFYNPSDNNRTYEIKPLNNIDKSKKVNLLYLGTLYDKRYPENLLLTLQKLNNEDVNISIFFVGNINDANIKEKLVKYSFVEIIPFKEDISMLLNECHILVDIDANIPNDVFISSKLNLYLSIPRPILCITPVNSPTDTLVKDCKKTVKRSDYKENSIRTSINELLNTRNFTYEERDKLLNDVSINTVGHKLFLTILNVVKNHV